MSEERLNEIKDSIELQMQVQQAVGYKNRYDDLLIEEIDLYNEVINLQQENARLKDKIDESIEYIRDCCDMDSKWVNLHYDYAQKEMSSNEVDGLLEILKEN